MGLKNPDDGTLTHGTRGRARRAGVCLLASLCVLVALLAAPPVARAKKGGVGGGNCVLTAYGVFDFGAYDPFLYTDHLFEAPIFDFRCSGNALEIEIDYGAAGAAPRHMSGAGHTLDYHLYQDANRTTPWNGPLPSPTDDGTLWLYGTIPARQDVAAGAYEDVVVVTFYP